MHQVRSSSFGANKGTKQLFLPFPNDCLLNIIVSRTGVCEMVGTLIIKEPFLAERLFFYSMIGFFFSSPQGAGPE